MIHDLLLTWLPAILAPLYLLAWLRGDQTARASVYLLVIGSLLYAVAAAYDAGRIHNGLGISCLLLAAQVVVALRSERFYPLVIAAAQLLIVCAYALAVAGLITQSATVLWLIALPSAVQLAAFAFGAIVHRRRRNPGRNARKVAQNHENARRRLAPQRNNAR